MIASRDIENFVAIVAALRTPGTGCAWDLAQTHASLVPYALEEAYEVVDAIERGTPDDLRDELGDLLLQVVLHARLAQESGTFDFGDVVLAIAQKMLRRHPHVFAAVPEGEPSSAAGIAGSWERIKADEKQAKGELGARTLDGVPLALPGLTRAVKLQRKASKVGFDWGDARLVLAKIVEEAEEIGHALDEPLATRQAAVADEIGDLIFAVANLARHAGIDPEAALRGTNAKFERRFAYIEDRLAERGVDPMDSTLDEMDALWDEAKTRGL